MDIAKLLGITATIMIISSVEGARILGVFPVPSYSHQIVHNALMTELHSRGHDIVVLTSHPMNNSSLANFTEIGMDTLVAFWKNRTDYVQTKESGISLKDFVHILSDISQGLCKLMFEVREVKKLLQQERSRGFDLIIAAWNIAPCVCGFSHHFSAPLVGFSTLGLFYSGFDSVGNPTHPVYFTDVFNPFLKNPTIWEKLDRLVYYIWYRWHWHTTVLPAQDKIARRYFGDNMPYIGDLENNVSLVFTSLQTQNHYGNPRVPALIELGPIHFKGIKPLSKDLQGFLDEASEGAIYFSLGTNSRSDGMPVAKRKLFLDAFSELKQFRILWKWDGGEIHGLPSNVKIGKWFPQQDILAHPNLKAFMYQGGLQSSDEAIMAQVPVIGIPFAVDQHLNIKKFEDFGAGIKLDFKSISKETIINAIQSIILDERYKENMKKLSEITRDQMQTPMEKAIWWTEYVIRHKGAPHLRSPAVDLRWYEFLLLDVVAFLAIVFLALVSSIYALGKLTFNQNFWYKKPKSKWD